VGAPRPPDLEVDNLGLHGIDAARRGRHPAGQAATSHWAVRDYLRNFGAEPVAERVVVEGKVITAGGVSAGIDMALALAAREAGEDEARALQLVIEYDPQPPYDSGSLEKAEPETKQRATEVLTRGVA
jgi:transcriptional regulator GlxA family with amidase domain